MDNDPTPAIKKPTTDLSRFSVVKNNRGSDRGILIERFVENLNAGRAGTKYKPYSVRQVAVMLSHLSTDDIFIFFKDCHKARNFGAFFHYALKPGSLHFAQNGGSQPNQPAKT